jgi:nucleotide-binding universal stress UspA family protein
VSTSYIIRVFHSDSGDRRDAIAGALDAELEAVALHRTVEIVVRDSGVLPNDAPAVGVYLGSPAAAADSALAAEIADALRAGLTVVPVVDDLGSFTELVPEALRPVNGYAWQGPQPGRRLVRVLLEELGIQEVHRRVFISHKREDGLAAAEQLHDELCHAGFKPFIDRFAIRSGQGVQETIADALEDYAFLLVLETPLAHSSDWVFDEVDYALSHTMGAVILSWPGPPTPVPGSNGLPRVNLVDTDLQTDTHGYEIFTDGALDRVVETVEAAHARGLVRRRRMLVTSTEEAALAAGCAACVPLPGWRLKLDHEGATTIVGTAPRLPTAKDLQALEEAAQAYTPSTTVLVHSARHLRNERRRHLEWVAGPRNLTLTPENAIGGRWTCH